MQRCVVARRLALQRHAREAGLGELRRCDPGPGRLARNACLDAVRLEHVVAARDRHDRPGDAERRGKPVGVEAEQPAGRHRGAARPERSEPLKTPIPVSWLNGAQEPRVDLVAGDDRTRDRAPRCLAALADGKGRWDDGAAVVRDHVHV